MKILSYLVSFILLFFSLQNSIYAQSRIDGAQLIEDLKILSSDEMEGRRAGTEGNARARQYILNRFQELGAAKVGEEFSHTFNFESRDGESVIGTNVIAKVEGETDAQIVISAHYDHLGIRDGEIFNGADDDASGTAALFSILEYFKKNKPKHTLIFAAFDAEESGLRGSRSFVENYSDLSKVRLNVNMDMISVNFKDELYAAGTHHYPELKPYLEKVNTGKIHLLFGHDSPGSDLDDWTFSSDHGAFHAKKIPFVYFGVEDHPNYHRSTDTFENVPQEFYKAAVDIVLDAVIILNQEF